MLKQDITEVRKARHKQTQEDFTPPEVIKMLCDRNELMFEDFSKTVCDPCCGSGNILRYILKERYKHCESEQDLIAALSTMYGTELMQDNTEECHMKILRDIKEYFTEHKISYNEENIKPILEKNIVCADTFKWDYENWKPIEEKSTSVALF